MEPGLLFLGVIVSVIVQIIKKYEGTSTLITVSTTVGLALLGAIVAWALSHFGYMEAFMQILATAGAFYAFIIRNVEKSLE